MASSSVVVVLLLLLFTTMEALETQGNRRRRLFREFTKTRSRGVWYAEGALSDPATGKVHATVRGVEVAEALPTSNSSVSRRAVAKSYEYAADVRQPATYAGVVTQSLGEDGTVASSAEVNGRVVQASNAKFSTSPFGARLDAYLTPEGSAPRPPKLVGVGGEEKSAALSRASKGLRCRETYVLSSDGVLSYTRFGECPAWVGPGKLCALDLTLRKKPRRLPFLPRRRPGHGANDEDAPPTRHKKKTSSFDDLERDASSRLAALLLKKAPPPVSLLTDDDDDDDVAVDERQQQRRRPSR